MSRDYSKPTTPSRLNPASRATSISIPGSRNTSRAPSPTRSRSPLPPTLRPVASFSSLRGRSASSQAISLSSSGSQKLTTAALPPHLSTLAVGQPSDIISSSSSVLGINIEPGEGIILTHSETDTESQIDVGDGEDGFAVGHIESAVGDEEARRNLREQLRRTLSQRQGTPEDSRLGKLPHMIVLP